MDLHSLRQFVAVAQELHFGRAAQRLGMAQPPLSQAVRRLEAKVGLQLFNRTRRRVELTDAGRYLLGEAQRLLTQAQGVQSTMQAIAQGQAGEVRIGYSAPAIHGFLAGELRRFRNDHPDIRLALRELTSDEQIVELQARRLHVGFLQLFGDGDGLFSDVIFREPFLLAIPRRHALARKRTIRLRDLNQVECIRFPRDVRPSYQRWILQVMRDQGLEPQVSVESTSGYANVALVSAGHGVSFAPRSMTRWPYPGVVYRPFADPLPPIQSHMVWAESPPPPHVQRLLAFMRQRSRATQNFTRRRTSARVP